MTETSEALFESCKELREALAAAMRVIYAGGLVDEFMVESEMVGIVNGIGVRAATAIDRYEKARLGILSI